MLFLHVLLFFVHFSSSAATRRNQPLREASASLQPPETESKINLGFIYWLPLTHFVSAVLQFTRQLGKPDIGLNRVPKDHAQTSFAHSSLLARYH